jgi:hypothetical protein
MKSIAQQSLILVASGRSFWDHVESVPADEPSAKELPHFRQSVSFFSAAVWHWGAWLFLRTFANLLIVSQSQPKSAGNDSIKASMKKTPVRIELTLSCFAGSRPAIEHRCRVVEMKSVPTRSRTSSGSFEGCHTVHHTRRA